MNDHKVSRDWQRILTVSLQLCRAGIGERLMGLAKSFERMLSREGTGEFHLRNIGTYNANRISKTWIDKAIAMEQ